jgi:DNA-binding winged helix-turn-helix (wHTH) protein
VKKWPSKVYGFGAFQLDATKRELRRDGQRMSLTPKALETLHVLVTRAGDLVFKEELLKAVWGRKKEEEKREEKKEDEILAQNISALRKIFGEGNDFIETRKGYGYRFVEPVTIVDPTVQRPAVTNRTAAQDTPPTKPALAAVSDAPNDGGAPVPPEKTTESSRRQDASVNGVSKSTIVAFVVTVLVLTVVATIGLYRRSLEPRITTNPLRRDKPPTGDLLLGGFSGAFGKARCEPDTLGGYVMTRPDPDEDDAGCWFTLSDKDRFPLSDGQPVSVEVDPDEVPMGSFYSVALHFWQGKSFVGETDWILEEQSQKPQLLKDVLAWAKERRCKGTDGATVDCYPATHFLLQFRIHPKGFDRDAAQPRVRFRRVDVRRFGR